MLMHITENPDVPLMGVCTGELTSLEPLHEAKRMPPDLGVAY